MGTLVGSNITYEFTLDEMKKLIAVDLGFREDQISVEYVMVDISSEMEQSSRYEAKHVKVTIDKTKPVPAPRLLGGRD